MDTLTHEKINSISKVSREVTLFLRGLGISDYYIIKIYELVGDNAVSLTEDDPYWLLDEFARLGFKRVDEIAMNMGVDRNDPRRLEAAVIHELNSYLANGHSFAPRRELAINCAEHLSISSEAIEDIIDNMAFGGRIQPARIAGVEAVYFYGYYRAESRVASRLAALANFDTNRLKPIAAEPEAVIRKYEEMSGIVLSNDQKMAVLGAVSNGVSIITGGPGTGKTTILNALIYILEHSGHRVALSAPTGRAAKRIMETGGHFAQTVHRLLEYYYDTGFDRMVFGRNSEEPLEYDCVIVDEASMLDIMLTDALADALREGTRLVIVGDRNQLPSVGAGNVLSDLIESEYFYTVELNEIYRQAAESMIVKNSHLINRGESPIYPERGSDADFLLLEYDKQIDIQKAIVEMAAGYPLQDVQVLSPMKNGILGTFELNLRLQERLNPESSDKREMKFGKRIFRVGDRVMQVKNDYQLRYRRKRKDLMSDEEPEKGYQREDGRGIFNGEVGTIAGIDIEMRSITVVYDDDKFLKAGSNGGNIYERFVEYEYSKLDELELAYAVTVHKSQGSEYPVVIIPASWFPPMLATKSLIYTAITRGKNRVIVIGAKKYLEGMAMNDTSSERLSALSDRLKDLYTKI